MSFITVLLWLVVVAAVVLAARWWLDAYVNRLFGTIERDVEDWDPLDTPRHAHRHFSSEDTQ